MEDRSLTAFRQVKIIATIGRSSCTKAVIKDMIAAGMDAARITDRFLEASLDETLKAIREAAAEMGTQVGIMLSLRESDVRVGFQDMTQGVVLNEGEIVAIAAHRHVHVADCKVLKCNNKDFLRTVEVGDRLLVDFGKIILTVVKVEQHMETPPSQVVHLQKGSGHQLSQLPTMKRSLTYNGSSETVAHQDRMKRLEKHTPTLKTYKVVMCSVLRKCIFTFEKPVAVERDGETILTWSEEQEQTDIRALQWANDNDIDSVVYKQILDEEALDAMLEFHVHKAKHFLGIQYGHLLEKVDSLLERVDGLVVCRGSLGLSSSYPDVCRIQKQLIRQCREMGKLSIVSTQILDSMMKARAPSSADITDLTESVLDGCDAVLIVGATASGDHPVEAIHTCRRIILEAEQFHHLMPIEPPPKPEASIIEIISYCAVTCASRVNAKTIICITHKTDTARIVSRYRPECPVVALTDQAKTLRNLRFVRGIVPVLYEGGIQRGGLLHASIEVVKRLGFAQSGDTVVYVAGEDDTRVTGDTCRFQICTV